MATSRHCGRSWAWAITNERSGPNQGPKPGSEAKPRTLPAVTGTWEERALEKPDR